MTSSRGVACVVMASALVLAPAMRVVRADDGVCGTQVCPAGSPREYEHISCSAAACECWNNCDGSSGGKGDAGRGFALLIAVVIFLPFAPLAAMEVVSGRNDEIIEERAAAKARWRTFREEIVELEKLGRASEKRLDELQTALSNPRSTKRLDAQQRAAAATFRPILAKPPPPVSMGKAQEACSQAYVRDYPSNPERARPAFCHCSVEAELAECANADWQCAAEPLARFRACLHQVAPPP